MALHLGETIADIDHLSTAEPTHFWIDDVENEISPEPGAGQWLLRADGEPVARIRRLFRGYEARPIGVAPLHEEAIVDPNWRRLVARVIGGELD